MQPVIYVHGGAGSDYQAHINRFLEEAGKAAMIGYEILAAGGKAIDAVEAAVMSMEDAPVFDAGRGSFPNLDGEIELDAMLMDGLNLRYGAVGAVQRVANPVHLARLVMDHTRHSLLVGAGAEEFAREMGIPPANLSEAKPWYLGEPPSSSPSDTVGAVALDAAGCLAVGVSTGGIRDKRPGRVGDSPLIGCGGYAENGLGAAAATGEGEALMKTLFSKTACDLLGKGLHPQAAAEQMLELLARKVPGAGGGIILLSPSGETGAAFNTQNMARARMSKGILEVFP